MQSSAPPPFIRSLDRLDVALVATAVGLVTATVVALGILDLHIQFIAPGLDSAIDTAATVVTGTVAGLALVRYRERAEPIALYQAAAFLVFFVANGFALFLILGQTDNLPGLNSIAGSQATPWVFAGSRLLTAALLVLGGLQTINGHRLRYPRTLFVAPTLAALGFICVAEALSDVLPPLSSAFQPAASTQIDLSGANLPMSTALGSGVQLIAAAGFLWAAVLTRTIFRRDRSIGDAYLAVGLVFAAGAQVHVSFYPGTYPGIVTSGDLLWLTFEVFLFLGIYAEARRTLGDMRRANTTLARLAEAEAENAALEERAWLSRELHDGLAQNLWLAKLQVGRLVALRGDGTEAIAVTEALRSVVDAALAEARQAVLALRSGREPSSGSLDDLLQRYADDFADRFGVEVECHLPGELPRLGPRVEAELLRIVQEALTNVRRHADATLARLEASVGPKSVTLQIHDNGRGFDPETVDTAGLGIKGMRERARLIEARLTIDSQPSGGATVMVEVPIPASLRAEATT